MRSSALALSISAVLAAGVMAAPKPPAPASFRDDPRLRTPLTLTVRDRPLGNVVRDVAAQTHVKLVAARETADDKATVFVEGKAAGDTLAHLAEHFGFIWVRAGEGWELTQSIAAKQHEQELALADLNPIRQDADQVASLLSIPQKQQLDRVKEIDAQLQTGTVEAARRPALEREKQLLLNTALSQPGVPRMSVELFRSLPEAQTAQLLDGDQLRLSTANHSLSDEVAKQIEAATEFGNEPGGQRQAEVVVWLAEGDASSEFGLRPRKERSLSLTISYNSVRGEGQNYRVQSAQWSAGALRLPRTPTPIPDDPFYKQSFELKLPGPEKALPAFYSPGPREGRRSLEYVWPAWPTVGDLAEALHRAGGPQAIADSFVSVRFDPNRLRGRHTLGEVLQFLDGDLDYTWRRDGDLLFLWSRHFTGTGPPRRRTGSCDRGPRALPPPAR